MRREWLVFITLISAGCFLFEESPPLVEDTDSPPPDEDCPVLSVDLTELSWTDVYEGTTALQNVWVSNACDGTGSLSVTLGLQDATVFALEESAFQLTPGESKEVQFTFSPDGIGSFSDLLTVRGSDGSVLDLPVTGQAILNPDRDGDGFDSVEVGGSDCDDTDPGVHPGAPDACYDGLDRDCDGGNDNDCDRDGFEASHAGGTDCQDEDASVYPGASELRNGNDDNCNGVADDGLIRAGEIVFAEFLSNPKNTPDSRGEWFEVRNTSELPIDIRGWVVSRGEESFTVMSSVRVPPLSQRVLANSENPGRNGGFVADYEFDADEFTLPNTTDQIYTLHFDGLQIATLPVQASRNAEGVAIGLDSRILSEAKGMDWTNWCLATSLMSGGDSGTPGTANRNCPGLDDIDMDGYTVAGGDCNDSDASVHPAATEVWGDWTDNDCSGQADISSITSLSTFTLEGGTTNANPHNWGYLGQLGVGDVDDDGVDEWLVGGTNAYDYVGGVVWLPSESYKSFKGGAVDFEEGHVEGYGEKHAFGAIGPFMSDNSGDGIADLVVGGHDYYEAATNVALALFEGGTSLHGALGAGDATAEWTGSESSGSATVLSHVDWNGDGVAEILYGESRTFYGAGSDNYRGRVVWLDGDGASGTSKLDDGDAEWVGDVNSDGLASTMSSGDIDDDGYGDVIVSASGRADTIAGGGTVYLVFGSSVGPVDGTIEKTYDVKLTGHLKGGRLGDGARPILADFDGDGDLDLALSAYEQETVYVFFSAGSLVGTISTTGADIEIQGDGSPSAFGLGLAAGDVNGDGFDELMIGAPDDDTSDPSAHATVKGAVYVFSGADLLAGGFTDSDASATATGANVVDGFGQSLLTIDVDGDGTSEILISEPGASSKKGRIRIWDVW